MFFSHSQFAHGREEPAAAARVGAQEPGGPAAAGAVPVCLGPQWRIVATGNEAYLSTKWLNLSRRNPCLLSETRTLPFSSVLSHAHGARPDQQP